MTLGGLIRALKECKPEATVSFDFCGFQPDLQIHSYRGFYEQIALGYQEQGSPHPTVAKLLALCEGAVGKVFTGYKGGEYTMTAQTPVWVDQYNHAYGTEVASVENYDFMVVIMTRYRY